MEYRIRYPSERLLLAVFLSLAQPDRHHAAVPVQIVRSIREMADAEWRLRSVRRYMESALSRHIATLAETNPSLDPLDLQSLAVETLAQTGCSYATWLRYETKFERQYDRAYSAWTRYQDVRRRVSLQEAELAMKQSLLPSVTPPAPETPVLASNVQIARNAPCPCGSREKYKRCCGKNAAPVLHPLPASPVPAPHYTN